MSKPKKPAEHLELVGAFKKHPERRRDPVPVIEEAICEPPAAFNDAQRAALGLTHMEMGEFDEAIAAYKKLDGTAWSWMIGMAYASVGLEDKAREMTAALEQVADQPGTAMVLSWIYMNLGEVETALHWLAETEKARTPWYPWLLGMFHGSELMADDPLYHARAAALGLPDPRTMGCRD